MADNAAANANGKVTLAVLGERLANLQASVDALRTDFKSYCASSGRDLHELERRVRMNEHNIARQGEKLTVLSSLNAAWTAIAAAVAGVFGTR